LLFLDLSHLRKKKKDKSWYGVFFLNYVRVSSSGRVSSVVITTKESLAELIGDGEGGDVVVVDGSAQHEGGVVVSVSTVVVVVFVVERGVALVDETSVSQASSFRDAVRDGLSGGSDGVSHLGEETIRSLRAGGHLAVLLGEWG
jgi:hypothetical protein